MRSLASVAFALFAAVTCGCASGGMPPVALAHNTTGAEHLAAGRLDEAEARFRLALEYNGRFADAHANLGLVALERGHLAQAERHLRDAIRINEDFAQAWGNLGVVLERRGHAADAEQAFERALSIDPGLTSARRNLAFLHARHGRFDRARAQLMRLAELAADDYEAQGLLAYCELRLGRPEAATARATYVLERDPGAAAARVVRGVARARRGDVDGAINDLEIAALDPSVGRDARTRLAAVRLVNGEVETALTIASALVDEDGSDAAARLVLASAELAAGHAERAERQAREALRLSPRLDHARVLIASACESRGDLACARTAVNGVEGTGVAAAQAARLRAALDR